MSNPPFRPREASHCPERCQASPKRYGALTGSAARACRPGARVSIDHGAGTYACAVPGVRDIRRVGSRAEPLAVRQLRERFLPATLYGVLQGQLCRRLAWISHAVAVHLVRMVQPRLQPEPGPGCRKRGRASRRSAPLRASRQPGRTGHRRPGPDTGARHGRGRGPGQSGRTIAAARPGPHPDPGHLALRAETRRPCWCGRHGRGCRCASSPLGVVGSWKQ